LLYDPNDSENLKNALKKVLSDEILYEELKQNCHASIRSVFNTAGQTDKIIEIYKQYYIKKV